MASFLSMRWLALIPCAVLIGCSAPSPEAKDPGTGGATEIESPEPETPRSMDEVLSGEWVGQVQDADGNLVTQSLADRMGGNRLTLGGDGMFALTINATEMKGEWSHEGTTLTLDVQDVIGETEPDGRTLTEADFADRSLEIREGGYQLFLAGGENAEDLLFLPAAEAAKVKED